ncbi:MAG TPA: glycosyltransferase family 39 protein [Actinomycetota bacterium]|jgi:uncharacterized membrane protein
MPEDSQTEESETGAGGQTIPSWSPLAAAGVAAVVVTVIARLWLPQTTSSLWLDETGTVWLLQGSFLESLGHTLDYQGGSPLYYALLWPIRALLGTTELALRLPSLAGMGAAAYLLYRLGRRLFDAGAGAIAAGIFVAVPAITFAASDARPYALAIAALVGSALALLNWLDSGRTRDGIVYALTFAATIYLHYLFALALLAQGLVLLFRLGRRSPVRGKQLAYVYGTTAVLLIPAVPILLRVASERGVLSNPYPQTTRQILGALFPESLAVLLVAGFALACLFWPPRVRAWKAEDGGLPFVVAWFTLPFVTLVLLTELTSTDLMVPRYFLSIVPAAALLIGAVVRRLGNIWPQLLLVAGFGVYAMTRFFSATHTTEDWRAAAELEREIVTSSTTPVLLYSGFIEAKQADWLRDPEKASYLNAPTAAYPFDGDPIYPLPFGEDKDTTAYIEEIAERMERTSSFVLVTRGAESHSGWFAERLSASGFSASERGSFGGQVRVFEFTRS